MIVTLQKIIEALRNELEQYGEILALFDHQQEVVLRRGADELMNSISAINAQSATIQTARAERQAAQQQLARMLERPADATFSQLIPLLPEPYRPLVTALVHENNELLARVRQRAQQNQSSMRRSLEFMQRFIITLSPQDQPAPVGGEAGPVIVTQPTSPLYESIV